MQKPLGRKKRPLLPVKSKRTYRYSALAIVGVFAVLGLVLVATSRAATFTAAVEAEAGTLTGNQGAGPTAGASNNASIKFGGGGTTTPPGTPPAASSQPTGVTGNWTMTFNDEFDGTALDTTKWNAQKSTGYNDDETACLDPSALSVNGGYLDISLTAASCQGKPNTGGAVDTTKKFKQLYGFFEARINLAGGGGKTYNFPAFWIMPFDQQLDPCWPTAGELDIMETIGGGAKSSYGYGNSCNSVSNNWPQLDGGSGNWSGWHTFAADWEPGSMTIYYDGKKLGSHNDSGVKTAMDIIIDNTSRPMGGQTVTGTKIQVDYVRVWKKN